MGDLYVVAGWADITPDTPCRLFCSGDLSGPYRRVETPIEATALVFGRPSRRLVFVALDLLYVGAAITERITRFLADRHGIPGTDVLLAASHTHFAPGTDAAKPLFGPVDQGYIAMVCDRLEALLSRLLSDGMPPAELRYGSAAANHSVNRRRYWPLPRVARSGLHPPAVVMAPNRSGPRDETVRCLPFLDRGSGQPIAVIWQYTCHPTGFPDKRALCAEYPGVVRSRIRHRYGKDLPVLFFQGFTGDIRPDIPDRGLHALALTTLRGPRFGRFDLAGWRGWADGIADAALAALVDARPIPVHGEAIRTTGTTVPLTDLFDGGPGAGRSAAFQRISLGGLVEIVGIGAEPVQDWARHLIGIGRSDAIRIPVGYCGDVFGYLPTGEQVRAGGYEADGHLPAFELPGRFSPRIDAVVTGALARLADA